MSEYKVWFAGRKSSAVSIEANDRDEARAKFAEKEGVAISSYIQARKASEFEKKIRWT